MFFSEGTMRSMIGALLFMHDGPALPSFTASGGPGSLRLATPAACRPESRAVGLYSAKLHAACCDTAFCHACGR